MEKKMRCPRCGNEEQDYFYHDRGRWYCRRCIAFGRIDVGEVLAPPRWESSPIACSYHLDYTLSDLQLQVVEEVCRYLEQGENVLIYAATGAGKTELTMEAICRYLRKGRRVGFAIARRQVVLEIAQRMQAAFPDLQVRAVCEGYTKEVWGDLIVCTMHQLYRYPACFELLIMDEVDAFPYRGNALLKEIAMHACIGQLLYLTATPDEEMIAQVERGELKQVTLFERPHRHPLVIPKVWRSPACLLQIGLFRFLWQNHRARKQTLVFVPTIRMSKWIALLYRPCFACGALSSKSEDRDALLERFRKKELEVLFATTVLERGITIGDVQVAVLHSEHAVFTAASLIQMIGRAGRKREHPDGRGLLLCTYVTKEQRACLRELEKMNESLRKRLDKDREALSHLPV